MVARRTRILIARVCFSAAARGRLLESRSSSHDQTSAASRRCRSPWNDGIKRGRAGTHDRWRAVQRREFRANRRCWQHLAEGRV